MKLDNDYPLLIVNGRYSNRTICIPVTYFCLCHGSFEALVSVPIRFPHTTMHTNLSLKVSCNLNECDRVTGMQTFDCKAHLKAFA